MFRIPPRLEPGPLTRLACEQLNQVIADLCVLLGGFHAAAPLNCSQDSRSGVSFWLDTTDIGGGSTPPFADDTPLVMDSGDNTKEVQIDAGGITTGNTRVWTAPDSNTTIPVFSQVVTFAGPTAARTVTLPDANTTVPTVSQALTISGPTAARTYTLPDSNQTLAGLNVAQSWSQAQTFLNTGLLIQDTDASHTLAIKPGSDLTANRILTIMTGDAARTVTIAGDTTIPIVSQAITISGPTAARTITVPDANFTAARTDAANTFTGTQTVGALVATTVNGNTFSTGTGTLTIADSKTLTVSNTITLVGVDATTYDLSGALFAGTLAVFPQWFHFTVTKSGSNWRVTDQDGVTTDTALAAATSQTITLTSPAGGVTLGVPTFRLVITTGLTGLTGPTMAIGYSGGDTSGGGSASSASAYLAATAVGTTVTRPRGGGPPANALDYCPHHTSAWNITLSFAASNNMTNLSGGQLDIWIQLSDVP